MTALSGDFNMPKINGGTAHPPPASNISAPSKAFLDTLSLFCFHQVEAATTRNEAILYLFITFNPEYITVINLIDQISDHSVIHIETYFQIERRINFTKKPICLVS